MRKNLFFIILTILLTSCKAAQVESVIPTASPIKETVSERSTVETIDAPTETPVVSTPTPSATALSLQEQSDLSVCSCSPIEGITLKELPDIISNPFEMPDLGKDDGHHGVDFAFYRYGDQIGMNGLAVNSMLPGTVAAIIHDRPPYGNTVIVETALENLSPDFLALLNLPEVQPTVEPFSALYCPETNSLPAWDYSQRSVYLLYAHMENDPVLNIGDTVSCCQLLGSVGTSGNSVNEHLHLELRVGPSQARFSAMAHYDNAATEEELANYCTWRVSNTFQLVDPMQLINLLPSN